MPESQLPPYRVFLLPLDQPSRFSLIIYPNVRAAPISREFPLLLVGFGSGGSIPTCTCLILMLDGGAVALWEPTELTQV